MSIELVASCTLRFSKRLTAAAPQRIEREGEHVRTIVGTQVGSKRPWLASLVLLVVLSCATEDDQSTSTVPPLGTIAQHLDTDLDGMDDAWETTYFGNLAQSASGDFDADGMTNGEEFASTFNPTVDDGFQDADGDRYPNVFEVRRGSDPNNAASTPTADYTVDGAGGGTHTTISAAVGAATIASGGAYQIIAVAPGLYAGSANQITLTTSKPKFLFIGLQGAGKTVLDGVDRTSSGWDINNSAVISSLTFRNWWRALYVEAPSKEVRFVDLIVRDNAGPTYAAGLHAYSAGKVFVAGSTFINNTNANLAHHIYLSNTAATITNTVVWSQGTGTMLLKAASATLTINNCLVKGQTLSGTGNLAGTVDPKLHSDGHLLWDSPLRGAGGSIAQSRVDLDGELRPSPPDIGVDQFVDSDADQLPDQWELASASNLTTLTSRAQDSDGDGLSNDGEYANRTNPIVADTDGDSVSDGDEVLVHGTSPLSADTDADEMPDAWEVTYGTGATTPNRFEDADGDGYPNIFEYVRGTNPASRASIPAPDFTVDGAGGGTHTTVSAAVSAATIAGGGTYQIIGVAPGVYKGTANQLTLPTSKPTFLIIGLQGAAKTIFDGQNQTTSGWDIMNSAVISSLTFRNWWRALYVEAPSKEVRFADLIVRDNAGPTYAAGLHVYTAAKAFLVGSTFLDNKNANLAHQIYLSNTTATITNTVVWSQGTGTMLLKAASATLTTNNCLVKGQTLTGTGNLPGTVNPKLLSDGHLRSDSPLRGAGGAVPQSRTDVDGEVRPASAPDIGVDQFNDADADGLPDAWEIATLGNTTMVDGAGDADGDGLSNAVEHDLETDWQHPDTDRDGVDDGLEVSLGMNPRVPDSDQLWGDLNHDGLIDSIGAQLGHPPDQMDDDGDGVSNADELLMCTNVLRSDTDGDGVPDNTDVFPHDPLVSALPTNPLDVTAPVITLTSPWYAIQQ